MRAHVLLSVAGLLSATVAVATFKQHDAEADTLAFRRVVPGLAADSGNSTIGSVLAGHVSTRADGGLVVTGDVTNQTMSQVSNVRIRVSVSIDGVTSTAETTAIVDSLAPLGVSPFRVIFPTQGLVDAPPVVEVLGFDSEPAAAPSASFAFAGPYPFQIGPPDPKTGVIPYSTVLEQLKGTVTNTSPSALTDIELVVAIYDGSGNVAWVGVGADLEVPFPVTGQPQVLPSGQSGTFIVGIPIGLLNSIAGHATVVGFVNATLN